MIRAIAVYPGDSPCAKAMERHAVEVARLFNGSVRLVCAWKPNVSEMRRKEEENPLVLIEKEAAAKVLQMQAEGVAAEPAPYGDSLDEALQDEARLADLLVLGLPPLGAMREDSAAAAIHKSSLPYIRKAEGNVLVVSDIPQPIKRICVSCKSIPDGKPVLRLAGVWAEKTQAELTVVAASNRSKGAAEKAGAEAKRYLDAFDIPNLSILEYEGEPQASATALRGAEECGADLLIVGATTYTRVGGYFWHSGSAEEVASQAKTPVLLARY
ncbi:MAG: universal stress protein [Verrucomicrobiota bacterium]